MFRSAPVAALFICAAPALAQPQAAQPNPEAAAEINAASEAFGACIGSNAVRADAEATPEVAASTVLAACAPQRERLINLVEAVIVTLPLQQQGIARERLRNSLASTESELAEGIRQHRAQAAAGPAAPSAPN